MTRAATTMTVRRTDDPNTSRSADDCGGCPLHDATSTGGMERRTFLRAAALAVGSLVVLGLDAREASALTIGEIASLGRVPGDGADEKRYPIPADDGVSIDRDNSVIIARAAGKVYAFALSCPHQNTALRWDTGDHEFHCPKHKSRYRADGTFIEGRATRDMDRLAMRRDGAALVVDVDRLIQQDENPTAWAAAFVAV
jgi:nitrite reductase/ring-hydroxylating ferredoxin subunit